MSFKVSVEDRVSTYPGRVVLTPVDGEQNTYDMERADLPLVPGTPINKKLFDSKADVLSEDVKVYVSTQGSDVDGTGSIDAPFASIQKAIDALPKDLGGHTATIDIAGGTYEERLLCKGFSGGTLKIGVSGTSVVVRGIEINASSYVEVNIRQIIYVKGYQTTLFKVTNGSNAHVGQSITFDGISESVTAMSATYNSVISSINGVTVTVNNCNGSAIVSTNGSTVALHEIKGGNNLFGLAASVGGLIAFEKNSLESYLGDDAWGGGRVFTGGGNSTLASASIE